MPRGVRSWAIVRGYQDETRAPIRSRLTPRPSARSPRANASACPRTPARTHARLPTYARLPTRSHTRAPMPAHTRAPAPTRARAPARGVVGRVKSRHHHWLPSAAPLIFLCARNRNRNLALHETLTGERQPILRTDYGGAILIVRTCEYCGKKYAARRNTSRYCSDNCRLNAYRKRNKGVCVAIGGNTPECLEQMEPISRVPASGCISAKAVERNTVELRGMGAFFDVASTSAPIKYRPMCSELSRGIAGLLREVGL